MERSTAGRVALVPLGLWVLLVLACGERQGPDAPEPVTAALVAAKGRQIIKGHVDPAHLQAPWIGRLPKTAKLRLEIGLPLRGQGALDALIEKVSTPGSGRYRRPLSLAEFVALYGPPAADYAAVVAFVRSGGLEVVHTFPNRLLVAARGKVEDIERVFHTTLSVRARPDGSRFFSPDRDPSVDLDVPLLHISGLDDYAGRPRPEAGSGPGGRYQGLDFRSAYASCTSLDGAGQRIGLVAMDGYTTADVDAYVAETGLPGRPPLTNVLLDGVSGLSSGTADSQEVPLDIEMLLSMSPGLSEIVVFEGERGNTILGAMATTLPLVRVLSSSWGLGADDNTRQLMGQLAAQGQSFVQSAGDLGSFIGAQNRTRDEALVTTVGGTVLTMTGAGEAWEAETAWRHGGGGITLNPIPNYQRAVDMTANGGSATSRNVPDVAMVADDVRFFATGAPRSGTGTSVASPLFAALLALANQRAAGNGVGPIGFANPTLYAAGSVPAVRAASFNDISDGSSNGDFSSVAGYDLTTGWGSPRCGLIDQIASATPTIPIPTYALLQVRITTGADDLRGNSAATLDVLAPGGGVLQTITLKPNGEAAWGGAAVRDLLVPLAAPVTATGVGGVAVHLAQGGSFPDTDDNWNIESLNVRLMNPGSASVCVVDRSGAPAVRLTGSAGTATFPPGDGCPAGPSPPPPPGPAAGTIQLIISTGADDLRGNSAARADLFAPGAATPFQTITLKTTADAAWGWASVHNLSFALAPPRRPSDIDRIAITLVQGGSFPDTEDNWNIQGINVMAFNPGEQQLCLVDLDGDPQVRLTGTAGTVTYGARSGCP